MTFLADQDVYLVTVEFLRKLGHDVITASDLGLSQASDTELLKRAQADGRIMVTRDRDYGNLVFVQSVRSGVIYMRVPIGTIDAGHQTLERVLASHTFAELMASFVVIDSNGYRLRRIA